MRHFPWITLGLLAACATALFITGYIAETHCSFGFGGFGCTQPFIGWGETLLGSILGFLALCAVLVVVLLWRVFGRWRRTKRNKAT